VNLIRNKVYEELRHDIVTCRFEPGQALRETDLADRYNVSKSPVRDALQRLQFEALVETTPRQGHRVVPVSASDAQDILEMREALETAALRRIVASAPDEDLASLNCFREVALDCKETFTRYNRRFHVELAVVSGNTRLAAETRRLLDAYQRLCLVSLVRLNLDRGNSSKALSDHCQIIDALQNRDARAAVRASQRHFKQSRGLIERSLAHRPIVD
jgi:DNA-binding GntR family transcriptional regulator